MERSAKDGNLDKLTEVNTVCVCVCVCVGVWVCIHINTYIVYVAMQSPCTMCII